MILRLLLLIVIFYLAYRLMKLLLPPGRNRKTDEVGHRQTNREDLIEDPYCHTYVPEGDAFRASIDGKTVHFCSKKCYKQYEKQRKEQAEREAKSG